MCGNELSIYNVDYSTPSNYGEGGNTILSFNGSNSYIMLQTKNLIEANLEFTISFFMNSKVSRHYQDIINDGRSLEVWAPNESGKGIGIYVGTADIADSTYYDINTWNHVAFTRDHTNKMRAFLNGHCENNFINSGSDYSIDSQVCYKEFYIGYTSGNRGNRWFYGDIDDLCIIAGKALWTENFTPPTTYLPDYNDL